MNMNNEDNKVNEEFRIFVWISDMYSFHGMK